ncbi:MAG: hypothetical protein J1F12_00560 [Muribaculaceae bacterium]|nr:hypothetical protein [Muribaculaceae bacterium]
MLSILMMQYGGVWCIVGIAGFILILLAGFIFDYRFFMLALMWVFLIIPMLIAFLYFFYGMLPLTTFNTIPHKIKFEDSRLIIEFFDVEEWEKNSSISGGKDENEDFRNIRYSRSEKKDITLEKDNFKEMKYGADYVLLFFNPPEPGWLWLPASSFANGDNFKETLRQFN